MSMHRNAAAGLAIVALVGVGGQRVLAHRAHHSAPSSSHGRTTRPTHGSSGTNPRCVPAKLNASAQLPGTTLTVSPMPGTYTASPYTQISLLGVPAEDIERVSVRGSRTGAHSGRLEPYSQGDGASFLIAKPLRPGEAVRVQGVLHGDSGTQRFSFGFTVAQRVSITHYGPAPTPKANPGDLQTFHTLPGVSAPTVKVLSSSAGQASGDIFAAPYSGPSQDGPAIFDASGKLIWFHPLPSDVAATNLQVQSYQGKPVLSWWQGYIPPEGFGEGEEIVLDNSYRTVMHVRASNGYPVDLHDFHIYPASNTALLTAFNPLACDLSSVHGLSNGAVADGVFEEIDLKTGLVRRQWHSLDHVALAQSYASPNGTSMSWPWDYFHINSVERRHDGSLLISSRNTSAVYFLDPATGQVTLQIGGKHSGVRMGNGTVTAYQHDAQELPDGNISIFDNGGSPFVHSQSRAIVISVNAKAKTDTLVAQYAHNKPLKSASQGNIQLLENGNFFVGWGGVPYFTEYAPSGKVIWDARLPGPTESYRIYRFPWTATPATQPSIAVGAPAKDGAVPVYASWNGATTVATWRVLGGSHPAALSPLASAPRTNFETTVNLAHPPAYLAVQALDSSGNVLGTSQVVSG